MSRHDHALPPLGGGGHDRQTELRARDDWWDQIAADPATRVLIVGHGRVAVHDGARVRMLTPAAAAGYAAREPGATRILLGRDAQGPVAAIGMPEVPDDLTGTPARTVGPVLDPTTAGLVVHALGLDNWHRTHPCCARCGAETDVVAAGHSRRCPVCRAQHFPRTDPAVIMLITDDDDRALLGHSPAWAEGRYSTLAGFVEPGESLEDAVRREVAEESAIEVGEVNYAGSQPWPFPSSLMLGFFARALTTQIQVDNEEVTAARWFTRQELSELCRTGEIIVPVGVSISRWLIDCWHGGELTGDWADW
ncbi:MAG: NAD(+) diphosphatase [Actinomycetota bacterium]|nr:NAD(+) diphosphatase [Actinomycetota bacterium]